MNGGYQRMCEEFVLSNGVRVVAEYIPHFPSVSVGLWIGAGSMYETKEESGLSHFVEHMLFKSTKNRTTKEIAVEMDAIGGQVNAFTAKDCTCYYAKVIAEHLERAMSLLSDLLLNAKMDEAEFEKERGVILEEIAMCEDTPEDLVYDLLAEAYFGDHPLARPILGTQEQIASVSREALIAFRQKHYRPDNTVLAIAGQFDLEAFKAMAERDLGAWQATGHTEEPEAVDGCDGGSCAGRRISSRCISAWRIRAWHRMTTICIRCRCSITSLAAGCHRVSSSISARRWARRILCTAIRLPMRTAAR